MCPSAGPSRRSDLDRWRDRIMAHDQPCEICAALAVPAHALGGQSGSAADSAPTMACPESAVIAAIDELTDSALAAGEQPGTCARCPHCHLDWHGLPFQGCPGSGEPVTSRCAGGKTCPFWSTAVEITRPFCVADLREVGFADHGYTIERIEEMRGGFERNHDL